MACCLNNYIFDSEHNIETNDDDDETNWDYSLSAKVFNTLQSILVDQSKKDALHECLSDECMLSLGLMKMYNGEIVFSKGITETIDQNSSLYYYLGVTSDITSTSYSFSSQYQNKLLDIYQVLYKILNDIDTGATVSVMDLSKVYSNL